MIHRYKRELSVAAAYGLLLLVLAIVSPSFYKDQFRDILISNAYVLVAAVGMTLVILCRQIDISIGSQLSICGVLAGLFSRAGVPMPLVALATMLAGAAMGAVNGLLVAWVGMPSIVVTLATLVIFGESLRWIRQGAAVQNLTGFQWFGLGQTQGQWVIVLVALLIFCGFAWSMRYLPAGRAVYAVGSDQEAARLAGIRPRRVTFVVFVVMGALTALSGPSQRRLLPAGGKRGRHGIGIKSHRRRRRRRRGHLRRPGHAHRHPDRRWLPGHHQPRPRLSWRTCLLGKIHPGRCHAPGGRHRRFAGKGVTHDRSFALHYSRKSPLAPRPASSPVSPLRTHPRTTNPLLRHRHQFPVAGKRLRNSPLQRRGWPAGPGPYPRHPHRRHRPFRRVAARPVRRGLWQNASRLPLPPLRRRVRHSWHWGAGRRA